MWNQIKDSSKSLFGRASYDKVYQFFFGVNVGADIELSSVKSYKSGSSPKGNYAFPEHFGDSSNADYDGIDCSRNLVVSSSSLFRKGPVPIEFLSHKEQIRLSKRGCLKEWDDLHVDTSDNNLGFEHPSSKSLLSYFARLGTGEDDKDAVNLAFVDSLLKGGATFDYPDVYGQSIFFAIVRDWHIDVAQFAVDRGANVNHQDKYGRTPLHLAAAVNYAEMVEFLIMQGANIYAKTFGEEQTALHYAARYDSVEAMKILIQSGAAIDNVDFIQRTPLQVAAEIASGCFKKVSAITDCIRYISDMNFLNLVPRASCLYFVFVLVKKKSRRQEAQETRSEMCLSVNPGSHEAVKFLLKLGAPTGVYDIYGNSAMFMMVEKMPHLAYEGMNQFFVEDNAMRRRYYYLDHLEFDVKARGGYKEARNVLQAIVMHKEHDLIMHPSIQKLLDVKWNFFCKRYAIISNFFNIFYTILATVLIYSLPFAPYDKQFSPVKDKTWKIVLAAIFFIMTFYFWIKQILFVRNLGYLDSSYKEHRLMCVNKQKSYCHPRWEEEKQYTDEEVIRIQKNKSTFWQDYWNIFEWISLVFVLIMFALHIVNVANPSKDIFKAAKLISAISLLLVWFRLYKTLRVVKLFSELTVLLGHVVTETCKFFLLFIDFYIPYVFLFFMLFGGNASDAKRTKLANDHELKTLADVAYHVWILTVKAQYPMEPLVHVDEHVAEIVVGTYFAVMAVLLMFIYIGRISEVFCRLHRKASANANLLIASLIINVEQELSLAETKKLRRHMRHNCGPMVVPFESNKEGGVDLQNINIGIDHVTTKVEEITNFLGKASFPKEEKQPVNIDHLTVLHTEVEKLAQRQAEVESELDAAKTQIFKSQKRTIELIKESIENRSNKGARRKPRFPAAPRTKSGYSTE